MLEAETRGAPHRDQAQFLLASPGQRDMIQQNMRGCAAREVRSDYAQLGSWPGIQVPASDRERGRGV